MSEENAEMTPEELLAKQEAEEAAAAEKAKQEAEAKAAKEKEAAEKKAKWEAEQKRRSEEAAAKKEAEAKAKKEAAELKAKQEAEAKAKAEAEAEKQAAIKEAAEQRAKEEAEKKAKAEAEAKKLAEAKKVDVDKQVQPTVIVIRPPVRNTQPKVSAARQAVVTAIQNEVSEDMRMHTQAGRALIRKFNEYTALCRSVRPNNQADITKCAQKLYDIVLDCCPRAGNRNAAYYRELIMIVYKRLSQGYGTLFTDAKLFRGDYNLPTPSDSMRFDAFWSAMYQLVEASKTGSRITFNSKTLGQILGSPSAMVVINQIRARLESVRDN